MTLVTQYKYGKGGKVAKADQFYEVELPQKYLGAFVLGLLERVRFRDDGRTHPKDQDWNEAYDHGMNAADMILLNWYVLGRLS